MFGWLCAAVLSLAWSFSASAEARTVRIGVLGIFHLKQITLSPDRDAPLLVSANGRQVFVESRSACGSLSIEADGDSLRLGCAGKEMRSDRIRATGRNQEPAAFVLAAPGKIARRYEGVLELRARDSELIPVVRMDLETAVASVVQAETTPDTPLEALKAEAVVSRSYLVAGAGRHKDFDFCDLTHCQALREPPARESRAAEATARTRDLVLTFGGKPIATMFTRSCGGRTRTPQELGLPAAAYPYFSVVCEACANDPVKWTRKVSQKDAALVSSRGESGRLAICRKLGWDAVPSNNFLARLADGEVILDGTGEGHGIGLCQRGAKFMAAGEKHFRQILGRYFPETKIENLSSISEPSH